MSSRKVVARAVIVALLTVVALKTETARADEVPDSSGGCTGTLESSTVSTHCCSYNSCAYFWDDYRTNDYVHETYTNPGCSQNTHVGSPGGCCDL